MLASSNGTDRAPLLWGEALSYVPQSALEGVDLDTVNSRWVAIDDEENGRYAYVVVNISDLIDVNEAGGNSRSGGADPSEIQLGCLSDVVDTNLFIQARAADVRYETVKELGFLQKGLGMADTNFPVKNFVTYSRFPFGRMEDDGSISTNFTYVGGSAASLSASVPEIMQAFKRSGICDPAQEREMNATINFFDFIDEDSMPANGGGSYNSAGWKGPYVDSFPMLNEVYCTNLLQLTTNAAGFNYGAGYTFMFECVYPFISPPLEDGYKIQCEIVSISNSNQSADWNFEPSGGPPWTLDEQELNFDSGPIWKWTTADPMVTSLRSNPGPLPANLTITATIDMKITDPSGNVVDAIDPANPLRLTWDVDIAGNMPTNGASIFGADVSRECIDPRKNWKGDVEFWAAGVQGTNTLGRTNSAALSFMSANALADKDPWMYIKNAPLESVGEIGAVYFGDTWQTARLYDRGTNECHTVLDNFTLETSPEALMKGRVNLNCRSRDVLKSVFTNMPVREYLDSSPRLDQNSHLNDIVNRIIADGPYTNLSDIGNIDWNAACMNVSSIVTNPAMSEIDIESFIRNSADLFGTRQQLFVIILGAGPFRIMPGIAAYRGDWLARSRAVAVVWRDPFPDENGNHPCFVRLFKTMGDE